MTSSFDDGISIPPPRPRLVHLLEWSAILTKLTAKEAVLGRDLKFIRFADYADECKRVNDLSAEVTRREFLLRECKR